MGVISLFQIRKHRMVSLPFLSWIYAFWVGVCQLLWSDIIYFINKTVIYKPKLIFLMLFRLKHFKFCTLHWNTEWLVIFFLVSPKNFGRACSCWHVRPSTVIDHCTYANGFWIKVTQGHFVKFKSTENIYLVWTRVPQTVHHLPFGQWWPISVQYLA